MMGRPDKEYITRWFGHIEATGEPETFEGVVMTKPSQDARVVLLSDDVTVPVAKRPDGMACPCPVCSPSAPKFGKGRMSYYPEERVARFIGHDCAKRYMGENYAEADRRFRLEQTGLKYQALWPKLQALSHELSVTVGFLYRSSRRLHDIRSSLIRTGGGFADFLWKDLAHRNGRISLGETEQTYQLRGLTMLRPDFDPKKVSEKAVDACQELRTRLPFWRPVDGENDNLKQIIRMGRRAERALKALFQLRDDIVDAAAFPTYANLRLLERWYSAGSSPFEFVAIERNEGNICMTVRCFAGVFEPRFLEDGTIADGLPTIEQMKAIGGMEILA